jgi:hypothetical protein
MGPMKPSQALRRADDQAADDRAGDAVDAADDEDRQRLEGDQGDGEPDPDAVAPQNSRRDGDEPGERPRDHPHPAQGDADRHRRFVVVGDGAQAQPEFGPLKEPDERGDNDRHRAGGEQVHAIDENAGGLDRLGLDAERQPPRLGAPEGLRETAERERHAERGHGERQRRPARERPERKSLDHDGQSDHQHHDEEQAERPAETGQHAHEGQRGEEGHRALGEVEDVGGLVDEHESQGDHRIKHADEEPAHEQFEAIAQVRGQG